MGIPADDGHETEITRDEAMVDLTDDGHMLLAERLNPAEASLVVSELKRAGIEAQIFALPDERATGPFDILVADEDAHSAYAVVQRIEIIEEPDNWLSARPAWQQAVFVVAGIIAVLIPLFFALVAILSN